MEPTLHPSSIPGLLVGQETRPTLPVVDAAPGPGLALRAAPTPEPPRERPSVRARRGSARVPRPGPPPLEAAQVQASWITAGVLGAISAVSLVLALAQGLAAPPASLNLDGSAPAVTRHLAAPPTPARVALDATVFHHDVEPILKAECWGCHGGAAAGELRLRTGVGGVVLEGVLPFVTPGRPEASLLLSEPLGPSWGGGSHPDLGWSPDSPQVQLLERWIAGSEVPSRVSPGEEQPQ